MAETALSHDPTFSRTFYNDLFNMPDGERIRQYLQTLQPSVSILERTADRLKGLGKPVVTAGDLVKLEAVEAAEAQRRGLEEFKFSTNEEMFEAMGMAETV
jgi:hypothetical protein